MQWIQQQNKLRNQTIEEKLEFVQSEITEYEIGFDGELEPLYGHLTDREIDGLDDAVDVFDWKEHTEKKIALFK